MSTERSSLERAIAREIGDEDTVLGNAMGAEQLELLRGSDGKLPGNVFQLARRADRSGPGRRPGSLNRRSDMLAKLVTQQHGDPVMAMASLYSRPLDQMIELVLIADSTAEREERLLGMIDKAETLVAAALKTITQGGGEFATAEAMNNVTRILERVFDAAKALKMKPGDLAIKALNLQLAAAKAVAEYVHSKKPVEVSATVRTDGVIVMPAVPVMATAGEKDALVRQAADGIAKMLADGSMDAASLAQYRFVDGQFIEAEFVEVDGDDAEKGA